MTQGARRCEDLWLALGARAFSATREEGNLGVKAPTITLLGPKRLWIIIVNIIIIIIVVVVVVAVRIPQNWAEPEECGRRRANIGWSVLRFPCLFSSPTSFAVTFSSGPTFSPGPTF